MQPFPHYYVVHANAPSSGSLHVSADGVPDLESADSDADHDLCRGVAAKAEGSCLVANSLKAQRELRLEIRTARSFDLVI
jgi:hypothetical protein